MPRILKFFPHLTDIFYEIEECEESSEKTLAGMDNYNLGPNRLEWLHEPGDLVEQRSYQG